MVNYIANRRFHFFVPTDQKGMRLETYEKNAKVPNNIVARYELTKLGYVDVDDTF